MLDDTLDDPPDDALDALDAPDAPDDARNLPDDDIPNDAPDSASAPSPVDDTWRPTISSASPPGSSRSRSRSQRARMMGGSRVEAMRLICRKMPTAADRLPP